MAISMARLMRPTMLCGEIIRDCRCRERVPSCRAAVVYLRWVALFRNQVQLRCWPARRSLLSLHAFEYGVLHAKEHVVFWLRSDGNVAKRQHQRIRHAIQPATLHGDDA